MTQQSHPDTIAAIDAVLAATEQPVRAATVPSSRSEILADLQALRGHHKEIVTLFNATREALHLPADCDRNAIPAAAAEAHDAARNLQRVRDDLAARLDAERLNTHTWATRAGLAQWDRDRLQRERDGLAADLRSAVRSLQEYAVQTARLRDTIATLRQIDRDATQLRADLDAGRVSDRLGEPAPADQHAVDVLAKALNRQDEDLRSPLAAERDSLVETIGRLVSLPPEDIARMHNVGYTGQSAVAPVPPARAQETERRVEYGIRLHWDNGRTEDLPRDSVHEAEQSVAMHDRQRRENPGWRATAELIQRTVTIGPWEPPARVPAGDDPTEG